MKQFCSFTVRVNLIVYLHQERIVKVWFFGVLHKLRQIINHKRKVQVRVVRSQSETIGWWSVYDKFVLKLPFLHYFVNDNLEFFIGLLDPIHLFLLRSKYIEKHVNLIIELFYPFLVFFGIIFFSFFDLLCFILFHPAAFMDLTRESFGDRPNITEVNYLSFFLLELRKHSFNSHSCL